MLKFFNRLPDCNTLFKKYLDNWYPEKERRGIPRPDIYTIAAYEGQPIDVAKIQYLPPELLQQNKDMINKMIKAAHSDFQEVIPFQDFSIEVIDKIDKYYNKKRVIEMIKKSNPEEFTNEYLVKVGEFGSMLGEMFTRYSDYKWLYSHPYFNSIIVYQPTGQGITVYDWAVKKFSSYGIDDGFAAKFSHVIKMNTK